jgi:hypothetical protein
MKIKQLFDNIQDITLKSYLSKCGIDNVDEYIKGCTLEDDKRYDNIDKVKEIISGKTS